MSLLVLGLILSLAGLCALALRVLHFHFHTQGRAAPDGSWAVAGAVEIGPAVISFVQASQTPAVVTLKLFGLKRRWGVGQRLGQPSKPWLTRRLKQANGLDWSLFLAKEKQRFRLQNLALELEYGFADVALTGKIAGAMYALSGVLPAPVQLVHRPCWRAEDRAEFEGGGAVDVFLLAILWDVAKFVLTRGRRTAAHNRQVGAGLSPDPEAS